MAKIRDLIRIEGIKLGFGDKDYGFGEFD